MSRHDLTERLMRNPRYAQQVLEQTKPKAEAEPEPAAPRKYPNQPVKVDGVRYDSKLEAKVHARLELRHGRDSIIRQVSIPIGSKRIRPDFLIIHERYEDGTFRAELADAKGHATDAWEAKANHLKSQHGLSIRLIKK